MPGLDPPPPRVRHGRSFVEFAADGSTAGWLQDLLQCLGSARFGRRRAAADGGEFLQVHTGPFDDRFCFEIIERRGGYAGDGTTNAAVRLAALAQWQCENPSTIQPAPIP